jgi:protein-disulfide isomerase
MTGTWYLARMKRTNLIAMLVAIAAACGGGGKKDVNPPGGGGTTTVGDGTGGNGGTSTVDTGGDGGDTQVVQATGTPSNDLIDRKVLFGNPERTSPQLSPDGKRIAWLAPKDGVRIPLTRDPKAPAPAVSVTYFHELACKHCAALRQMIAALPARDPDHVVLVPRVILVHRAPSMAAHLVECAAHRLGHDVTDALWAGAFDARDYTSANLLAIAIGAGVDGDALVRTVEAGDCLAEILADHVLALRAGVRGTPTFFVNGIPIEGLPDDKLLFDAIAAETRAAAAAPSIADYHAGWQATARSP